VRGDVHWQGEWVLYISEVIAACIEV